MAQREIWDSPLNANVASLPNARVVGSSVHDGQNYNILEYDTAYDMVHRGADAGRGFMDEAVDAARKAQGTGLEGAATMRGDAATMRQQAGLVNSQANAINQDADALAALVPQLDPYKAKFDNYGDDLAALAATLQGGANDVFGQGAALVGMDPTKGGLSAEFLKQYGLLSPERYVSRYASDTQGAIDNTRAQTERYLARRGVNVGSGANAGLMNTLTQMKEAAALAAAKTLGYDKGVTEQGNFLKEMTGAANTLYGMGREQQALALSAKGQAADMAAKGAGIVSQQGGLIQNAAGLRQNAAALFSNAANIFGNAAGVEGSATQLSSGAENTLASALNAAASYYLGASQAEANAAYRGQNWKQNFA